MRQITNSQINEELPNGFIRLESGALLTREQYLRLVEIDENTAHILIVDVDLQKQRTYEQTK